jgi:hypothetical protein
LHHDRNPVNNILSTYPESFCAREQPWPNQSAGPAIDKSFMRWAAGAIDWRYVIRVTASWGT